MFLTLRKNHRNRQKQRKLQRQTTPDKPMSKKN